MNGIDKKKTIKNKEEIFKTKYYNNKKGPNNDTHKRETKVYKKNCFLEKTIPLKCHISSGKRNQVRPFRHM